jgi:4-carboxymuconolactone decarboxylase
MRPLGAGLLGHGRLSMRERELVIDRACARAGAEYEWECTSPPSARRRG